jgi:hypothetical protein
MGLQNEKIAALSFVTADLNARRKLLDQIGSAARSMR